MSELLDKQVDTENENLKIKIPGFRQALVKCAIKIKESILLYWIATEGKLFYYSSYVIVNSYIEAIFTVLTT